MKKIAFNKAKLMKFMPCGDGLKFAESCDFDFHKIFETCPRGDWLMWLLRRAALPTKEQSVKIACEIALQVMPILEKKYPKELRPRKAIEAALAWVANPTPENQTLASAARCEASKAAQEIRSKWFSSAAAADAAYDAAAAAYAAAADADAAAYAAAADAAYAAYAAAYAADADAARKSMQKTAAEIVRANVKNPFKKGVK